MKRIAFVNQKGGVGKTLLADETAFYFEKNTSVSFIDLDMQGGAIHETNYEKGQEYEYQIIDTPGALEKNTKEWMNQADVVVIPTKCHSQDMIPLERMMEIASQFDKSKFIIVFNCWNRFKGVAKFINWFNIKYPGYKTFLLQESVALTDASSYKMSVLDFKPKHKVAESIQEFMNLLEKTLGE